MSPPHPDATDSDSRSQTQTARRRLLDRRQFMLASGTLAGVAIAGATSGAADDEFPESGRPPELRPGGDQAAFEERYPGLRVMDPYPENAEAASRSTYTKAITPPEEHYVRNQYPTPEIDAAEWSIELRGLGVDDPVELDVRTLREEFSTESVAHTMQCSGNGRAAFDPEVDGVQWTTGAVGTTVWTGAPLREILEAAGAETGDDTWLVVAAGEHPDGEDVFARSIPMEKVLEDCILAYEMGGEPLTPDHGYPVRLVVPGWFGNNCVKWVAELEVLEKMHGGDDWEAYVEWQHESYRMLAPEQAPEERESIDEFDTQAQMDAEAAGEIDHAPYLYDQFVKSIVGYPRDGATIEPREADGKVELVGVAWAGDDRVERVEVSVDGGETWDDADFFGEDLGPYGWRQFRYCWDPTPGAHTIASRATDEHGRSQPRHLASAEEELLTVEDDRFPWNRDGYGNNAYLYHAVDVTVVDDGCE